MIKFIFWLVACFFSTMGFTLLYCKIVNVNPLKSIKFWLFFLVGSIALALVKYYNITNLNSLLFFIIYPILFYIIKPLKIKAIYIHVIIVWLYGFIFDSLSVLIVSLIYSAFKVDVYQYYNLLTICLSFFVFILFILVSNNKYIIKKTVNLINKFLTIRFSSVLLFAFTIFTFSLGIILLTNIDSLNATFTTVVFFVMTFLMLLFMIYYRMNEIENQKYLKTLKDNNDFYIKLDDENKIFKHNLIGKLMGVKSVSNEKAVALLDDIILKYNKNVTFADNIKEIPYGINGIIYEKLYSYLEEINFKIYNDINYDIFEYLKPRRYNVLVEKLVVSLDNAIEACMKSKDKLIIINMFDSDDKINIEIKNSFSNNLDLDDLGNINYSTKGSKRGLGLFSILRDKEANVKVKIVNNYFVSTLVTNKQSK